MPIYEFKCNSCQHIFEELLSIGKRDEPCCQPCPQCKKREIQRDWRNTAVMGCDATVGPGAEFKALSKKISRSLPASAKVNMERAASLTGRKYGCR